MASNDDVFGRLRKEIERLRARLIDGEGRCESELSTVAAPYRESAVNLIHYLVARQVDLRPVQIELGKRGLSSLGRMEGHVQDALDQVLARLDDAISHASGSRRPEASSATWDDAERLLHRHTHELFGKKPDGRHVYVMVTAPDAAEVDDAWVGELLDRGTNLVRINGAHEGVKEWEHVARAVRRVAKARDTAVRILVDLPGPKLRTVAPGPGQRVSRWKPERDVYGNVTAPCDVELIADGDAAGSGPLTVRAEAELVARLRPGDEVFFVDARGKRRSFALTDCSRTRARGHLRSTAYVVPETTMRVQRGAELVGEFRPEGIAERPFRLTLAKGDRFRLEPLPVDGEGAFARSPVIGCGDRALLQALELGARVLFDDGRLETLVEGRTAAGVVLRVTHAPESVFHLYAEKGINAPETRFEAPTLGPDDERALAFAVASADMVGASFVRDRGDVRCLHSRLEELGAARLGVVLKIETASAFHDLPAILLAAMARYPFGVMIARGDLAVEVGFERLAELQEEILWLCEAAHVPVIWATQVLDRLAHTGCATRAEVTDAAMAVRAECVMLNKGPYIAHTVTTLVDILRRMEHHQYKKRSLYRRLRLGVPSSLLPPTDAEPGPQGAQKPGSGDLEEREAPLLV